MAKVRPIQRKPANRLKVVQVLEIKRLLDEGWRQVDIAFLFGITQPMVSMISTEKRKAIYKNKVQ